ncbi:MAG: outer membrane protein assembly factor BamA [Candidatus Sumerlaeia bacterium]|nr:outer membrane protein assembly factor BamA [Candidatus Sumerlaeia bacterium]
MSLSPVRAQDGEIVREIEIQGLSKISREKVLYALPVQVGKPFQPRLPGEIIQALWNTGYFSDQCQVLCENVPGGIKLIIVVHENPSIKEIQFVSNMKIPTATLKSASPVKEGDVLGPDSLRRIRESVEQAYRTKGYSNALVRVDTMDNGTSQVVVQVVVDEGERLKIKDLILRGNRTFGTTLLKFLLESKGSWLFIENHFNSEAFQTDLDILRQYYFSKGFFDVQVRAGEFIQSNPPGLWISPVIEIEEGPRYRVGEIRPSGYTIFMPDQLIAPFQPLQGKYYDAEKFKAAMQKVKDLYGDEGYINAEILPDHTTDPERGMVHFDLRIEEHQRVYVRKILIRKNEYPQEDLTFIEKLHAGMTPPVRDEVIQREVMLKPGEAYRRFQEVATADRLRSMDIFDSVKVESALTDDETQRDVVLELEEGNTGNLIFGAGLSELQGAYVHAAYLNRNLFGQARHLRTSALLGTRDIQFRATYMDRYFDLPGTALDRYFKTEASGLVPFRLDLYRDAMRLREYDEIHTGISAVITRILRQGYVTEDWGARLEFVQTDEGGGRGWRLFGEDDDDIDDPAEDFGSYPVAALSYYIEENTTDDWFNPTRGHIVGGGVEGGFADGPLLKLTGRYSLYKQLNENLIYALNTKLGWMPLNAQNVGISERLFMGGSGDLRGFAFRGAGPTDRKDDDLHIGGSLKLLVQNELRFPIYKQLKGVAFTDVGMLSKRPFEFSKPRMSAGVGLRFTTAKGRRYGPRWKSGEADFDLLRGFHAEVSLGVPIIRDSDDDKQFIHFILGSSF